MPFRIEAMDISDQEVRKNEKMCTKCPITNGSIDNVALKHQRTTVIDAEEKQAAEQLILLASTQDGNKKAETVATSTIKNNGKEANKLLEDKEILDKSCNIFIPNHRLIRRGVIRGVDTDVEEDDILNNLKCSMEINNVKRITKRNLQYKEGEDMPRRLPTTTVIVSFVGQDLPVHAYLYGISHEVSAYIAAPRICISCYKPGHNSSDCGTSPKCKKCSEIRHDGECINPSPKCPSCQGDHFAMDKRCPVIIREQYVQYIVAMESKTIEDARKIDTGAFTSHNVALTKEAFPPLTEKQHTNYQNCPRPVQRRQNFTANVPKHVAIRTVPPRTNWYKFQEENCPDFLGRTELHGYQPRFTNLAAYNKTMEKAGDNININLQPTQERDQATIEKNYSPSRKEATDHYGFHRTHPDNPCYQTKYSEDLFTQETQEDLDNTLLRIMLWNARSYRNKVTAVRKNSSNFDVIVIVESWLTPDETYEIQGFCTYRHDRIHADGGGILIFIREDLAFSELPVVSPLQTVEMCGIKINNVEPNINLYACYRAPECVLTQSEWHEIVGCVDIDGYSLFLGDFNAKNINWNCNSNDDNGLRLEVAYRHRNLYLHNFDTQTYIKLSTNYRSNLDLIFLTQNLSDWVNYEMCDVTYESDHFPLYISVNAQKYYYSRKTFKCSSTRTDWNKVEQTLQEAYSQFFTIDYELSSPVEKYNMLTAIITESVKLSTPAQKQVSKRKHRNPVVWWDAECDRAVRLKTAAFKKYLYSLKLNDFIEYKKQCASAKNLFKIKQKNSYQQFTASLNFRTNPTYVWNRLKAMKNRWVKARPSYITENLQNNESELETALKKICPPWAQTNPESLPHAEPNAFFDNPFSFAEFNHALDSKNLKSAPGMDGIDFGLIYRLPIQYKLLLLDVFNSMYITNSYPDTWGDVYIHFVKKPNGKGYRPLSLTPCLCKLLETLIKNRMQWWAENNNILPGSQHGFRRGNSCIDDLMQLTLTIEEAFREKSEAYVVFLDVESAFDQVNIDILLRKLAYMGFSSQIVNFVNFITRERHVYSNQDSHNYRSSYKGVPQGAVLSPLLYALYTASIISDLPDNIHVSQFADDLSLYVKSNPTNDELDNLKRAIDIINFNLHNIGLNTSLSETKLLHANKRGIKPGQTVIEINNVSIKSSEWVKFLGVVLDYRLSFQEHITQVHRRCTLGLKVLKYLRGTWWGTHPETLLILYKSYVRSLIDYACFVYLPNNANMINKLEKIQYAAIRYAMGYRMSTPTNILLAETGLISIRDRASYLCQCYLVKILSNIKSESATHILTLHNKLKGNPRFLKLASRCIVEVLNLQNGYNIAINNNYNIFCHHYFTALVSIPTDLTFGIFLQNHTHPNQALCESVNAIDAIPIYTDGSKIKNSPSVGSACIIPAYEFIDANSLNNRSSIFSAECYAINSAFNFILTQHNKNFVIFSDSLSALKSLSTTKHNIKTNILILDIKLKYQKYLLVNPNNSVRLVWVRAHTGIYGNESADSIANQVLSSFLHPVLPSYPRVSTSIPSGSQIGDPNVSGISDDRAKNDLVVASLEAATVNELLDVLEHLPTENLYGVLKEAILSRLTDSQDKRLDQLFNKLGLGDKRPLQLLRSMRSLSDNKVTEEVLKVKWLHLLSPQVTRILKIIKTTSLEELGSTADDLIETNPGVFAVSSTTRPPSSTQALNDSSLTSVSTDHQTTRRISGT
ncbi:uncharacterized protein LOC106643953 [Copidosoma floridanum]|uniref:uncharacterized protein LOC106643953 n=1 Tax=Copidosoma floridanum TaxID=29053 RepID=UPI0006C9AADB|nr:uncharacterized protein LOC106643953 [Copidosoma floridanum]